MIANYESIRLKVQRHKPSMLMCSETCITDQINDFEIDIDEYNIIRCNSHSRHTGGVAIYVHVEINYNVLLNICFLKNVWCIVIEIKNCALKGVYMVLYHSPNTSHSVFLNYFNELCKNYVEPSKMCCIVGDFNIDVNKNTAYSRKLKELF